MNIEDDRNRSTLSKMGEQFTINLGRLKNTIMGRADGGAAPDDPDAQAWNAAVGPSGRPEVTVGLRPKPGQTIPPQYGTVDPSQWPQTAADVGIAALGPLGEAGMTVGDMLRTGQVDPRDVVGAAGNVLLGVGVGPGAPEARAAEAIAPRFFSAVEKVVNEVFAANDGGAAAGVVEKPSPEAGGTLAVGDGEQRRDPSKEGDFSVFF